MPDEYDRIADLREITDLRERARRARYVAWQISDKEAAAGLMRYAEDLEMRASALEAENTLPPSAAVPSGEPPISEAVAALKPETPPAPESASEPSDDASEPEPA